MAAGRKDADERELPFGAFDEEPEAPPPSATTSVLIPAEAAERDLEETLERLPASPGVYLMKDAQNTVLYVGKAQSLRSRVRSYFRASGDERAQVKFLRPRIRTVDVIVTDNEKEALLLENTLIKKHKPRYNVRLRDDKTYVSLRLDTTHEWPRLHRIRRRIHGDKALYFGPFSSSTGVKETMRFLTRLFPLRSCPNHVLTNRSRPCVLHQIDRCCAPCVGLADRAKYAEYVENTRLFLEGRQDRVLELLRGRMEAFSEALAFEKAALVRDQIRAIERTIESEKVHSHRAFDRDVFALERQQARMVVQVLCFRRGRLEESRPWDFRDIDQDDGEVLESFVGQFYSSNRLVPRDILFSHPLPNGAAVKSLLEEIRGGAVRLMAPERGEKRRLVAMAAQNARQVLDQLVAGEQSRTRVLDDLAAGLGLPAAPRHIECFDISNFQGAFAVGSMTCFIDGEPEKARYRHFKVRNVEGQNDFAAMREVVGRRYRRVLAEGGDLPDLVVIDGGKGQLAMAVEVFRELGLTDRVPVVALAKSRILASSKGTSVAVRRDERVFLPGRKNPVVFSRANPALFILTRIRDEAHRFGVSYHRKLRSMGNLRSGLEELPGVGAVRRRALLKAFGSLARLREATPEQIAEVPGITARLAQTIHDFLRTPAPTPPQPEGDEGEDEENSLDQAEEGDDPSQP